LALGAKLAKVKLGKRSCLIKHAWATDYDHDSCETYRSNICPETPKSVVCEDIRHLDFNKLKNISDIDGFPLVFHAMTLVLWANRKELTEHMVLYMLMV